MFVRTKVKNWVLIADNTLDWKIEKFSWSGGIQNHSRYILSSEMQDRWTYGNPCPAWITQLISLYADDLEFIVNHKFIESPWMSCRKNWLTFRIGSRHRLWRYLRRVLKSLNIVLWREVVINMVKIRLSSDLGRIKCGYHIFMLNTFLCVRIIDHSILWWWCNIWVGDLWQWVRTIGVGWTQLTFEITVIRRLAIQIVCGVGLVFSVVLLSRKNNNAQWW